MNATGGLVMTKTPKWKPSYELIANKLCYLEKNISSEIPLVFIPISRWKGYSGARDTAADAIESISLSSFLLSRTTSTKIFSTITSFAYEPELVGHISARLNYEFNNRFAINFVGGWKRDEYEYFKKPFLDTSKLIYQKAEYWTQRFRLAEDTHAKTLVDLLGFNSDIRKTELICAAFSKEGRDFASKYSDSLFTTIIKSQINKENLSNLCSAISVFVREDLSAAEEYYKDLLIDNCDHESAKNFCSSLAENNPIKSFMNLKNIHLVKSGAGIEEIITDFSGLKEFILKCKNSRLQTLLFALPDYEKSLDLVINALKEVF